MPRIAQIGDLHINRANRFEDTLDCLDFAVSDGIAQGVDLWVIPGDLFDTKSTPEDRNALASALKRMAAVAPVIIAYGNHDKPGDLDIFELLETEFPINVFSKPAAEIVGGVVVCIMPHFDKSMAASILPPDMAIEQSDEVMVEAVRRTLQQFEGEIADTEGVPAILIGHLTIAGSILSNGEPHPHQGVSLSIGDLTDVGFDAVMLSHIHKAQVCDAMGLIRYAGSISRANFGESQDPKGWWLWDIAARGEEPRVEFREVPARPMLTFNAELREDGWDDPIFLNGVKGAEVRVRITFPEDRSAEAQAFADDARRRLVDAHNLQIEIRSIPVSRVRAGEIAKAQTPAEKLEAFWGATERPDVRTSEGILAKLADLVAEVC